MKGGIAEKERWENAWKHAKTGNIEDIDKDIVIRQYSQIKSIVRDFLPKVEDNNDVCGIWIHGESGAGKSKLAREMYPNIYDKMCNKWWDGYRGEPEILIDDFDISHACLSHHLKRWTDRYSFRAEIKGTASQMRPKVIVVTSQYTIEEIWTDEKTVDALNRRFKKIHVANMKKVDTTK